MSSDTLNPSNDDRAMRSMSARRMFLEQLASRVGLRILVKDVATLAVHRSAFAADTQEAERWDRIVSTLLGLQDQIEALEGKR